MSDFFFPFMRRLKQLFVPYTSPFQKIRIGNMCDGGYVIADVPHDICYSYGCDDNIQFENGMYEKYKTVSYTYDHTVNGITDKPDYITFKKEGVSPEKTTDCNTIQSHIEENGHTEKTNLMLKMDIEFAEWLVIRSSMETIVKHFSQLVIEFHFFNLAPEMLNILEKLLSHYKIIHMHANHYPMNPYVDIEFPKVLEVSLLRNEYPMEKDTTSTFPDPLLDPNYPIPFPELKWWKREYDAFSAVSLKNTDE